MPSTYVAYFQAASQAAGALIGLLFVVVALRPGRIVGPHADPVARRLAAGSFTGLVDAFFVSLLAIIPGHVLGAGAVVMAVLSLYRTLRLNLAYPGARRTVMFAASLAAYVVQLGLAIAFVLSPGDVDLVKSLTFVMIAAFAVGLNRAWALLQYTTAEAGQGPAAGPAEPSGNGSASPSADDTDPRDATGPATPVIPAAPATRR